MTCNRRSWLIYPLRKLNRKSEAAQMEQTARAILEKHARENLTQQIIDVRDLDKAQDQVAAAWPETVPAGNQFMGTDFNLKKLALTNESGRNPGGCAIRAVADQHQTFIAKATKKLWKQAKEESL